MPKWRNGRRDGLKHRWVNPRAGSSPAFGTKKTLTLKDTNCGFKSFFITEIYSLLIKHRMNKYITLLKIYNAYVIIIQDAIYAKFILF